MNYSKSLFIKSPISQVYIAITSQLELWWGRVDNSYEKIGDQFSVFFDETEWKFEITELNKNRSIAWHCIKAHHIDNINGIKEEWLNTYIKWNLYENEGNTKLEMEHIGLISDLNCYGICEAGWNFFLGESLKKFLETGQGNPYNN